MEKACKNCGTPITKEYCEDNYPEVCEHWTPKKPKTNADRIRAMSDEKLAEFLFSFEYATEELGAQWDCQGEVLQWLQEPEDLDDDEGERLPRLGRWVFWDGWVSNHDLRIDDAFCSECGYQHPTVRLEEGYPTVEEARASVRGKLAKECPQCGARMIGGGDGEGG